LAGGFDVPGGGIQRGQASAGKLEVLIASRRVTTNVSFNG
jgi:hypothetical protein